MEKAITTAANSGGSFNKLDENVPDAGWATQGGLRKVDSERWTAKRRQK